MTLTTLAAALAALSLATTIPACKKASAPSEGEILAQKITVPEATVDQVDGWLTAGTAQAIDANGAPTRSRVGVVPGAVLLSDYETFAMSELPADKRKKLVFYCANEQCHASHEAAARAIDAGYKDVACMPAGIAGWVKAGKKIQPQS